MSFRDLVRSLFFLQVVCDEIGFENDQSERANRIAPSASDLHLSKHHKIHVELTNASHLARMGASCRIHGASGPLIHSDKFARSSI